MLILVIEDESYIREGIAEMLATEEYSVITAATLQQGQEMLLRELPAVVLSDINLPDGDGFAVLNYCRQQAINTAVIFMTAFGSRDLAVRAIQQGAYDYIAKPIRFDELFARLKRLDELQSLQGQIQRKSARTLASSKLAVLGDSSPMQHVRNLAEKASSSFAPLLITGETGVGKGMLARLIHASSTHSEAAFVSVNCASIPEHLLESELFGYRKGAFTGADRNQKGLLEEVGIGTLFLDEIGDMPIRLQAKLLHVLDDGCFRPLGNTRSQHFRGRVIAATNVALQEAIKQHNFRQDLYYRLSVLIIDIPPLRNRPEDLLPLANSMYQKLAAEMGRGITKIPQYITTKVLQRSWAGNVRELKNYLERSLIFDDAMPQEDCQQTLAAALQSFEYNWIERTIAEHNGDKAAAAKQLGLSLSTLYRKMHLHN